MRVVIRRCNARTAIMCGMWRLRRNWTRTGDRAMSEPLDIAQWAKNWEAMARQAQAALAGNAVPVALEVRGRANTGWADTLAKANPFADGKQQNEAMERMLSGAQGYLGMLQSLAAAAVGQPGGDAEKFADTFRNGMFPGAFLCLGDEQSAGRRDARICR